MKFFKTLTIAVMAIVLLGTSPLVAQIAGTWEGTGTGSCPNPFPTPPESMCPWRSWTGEIPEDESSFEGRWRDPLGFHGTFWGEPTIGTPTEVVFEGTWTAIDDSVDPPQVLDMGPFLMHFSYDSEGCYGKWWTYDSDIFKGTVSGWRVE